ncbi:MAG: hypothetical protein WD472_01035 [Dehalococcoidia bacterium]
MMWRILPALVLVAIAMPFLGGPRPALGCSIQGGPPNYAAKSDVIVGGRVTGWAMADDVEGLRYFDTIPIVLAFDVEDSLKGAVPKHVEIVDRNSLDRSPRGSDWNYISWPCHGSDGFHEDPTGSYLIMGFSRNGDSYESGHVFYRAESADREEVLGVVSEILEDPYGDPSLTLTVAMSLAAAFPVWLGLLGLLGAWAPRRPPTAPGTCFSGWLWFAASQRRPPNP